MLDKRYQVFVSSTYEDLKEERKEVMQALLELDCIPAGMELFPAADADQWSLIKKVIEDSDYYLLILGGRYGSTTSDGISYTQKEYEYAASSGKPIIGFLHKNPSDIVLAKSEPREENREKLMKFRELVQQRVVKYWTTPAELGSVVSRSVVQLIKSRPSPGWVRADKVPDIDATNEIFRLRRRIDELETEVNTAKKEAPSGSEELSQGSELIAVKYRYQLVLYKDMPPIDTQQRISAGRISLEKARISEISWDNIFSSMASKMLIPVSESHMVSYLTDYLLKLAHEMEETDPKFSHIHTLTFDSSTFEVIKIQLRALGLIVADMEGSDIAWKITLYGDYKISQLLAIKPKHMQSQTT